MYYLVQHGMLEGPTIPDKTYAIVRLDCDLSLSGPIFALAASRYVMQRSAAEAAGLPARLMRFSAIASASDTLVSISFPLSE